MAIYSVFFLFWPTVREKQPQRNARRPERLRFTPGRRRLPGIGSLRCFGQRTSFSRHARSRVSFGAFLQTVSSGAPAGLFQPGTHQNTRVDSPLCHDRLASSPLPPCRRRIVGQNQVILRHHSLSHERGSEQINEHSGARQRSEQGGASE